MNPHDPSGGLPPFPFSALIGQAALQQALLLVAVDPSIGGVLVSGPRGTAKSTAARALAELLPRGRFVTLPLGAADEHVTGTLDLAGALGENAVRFSPGLLARAHLGVLYVDEINLLPDGLVDVLLDAAASGVNTVERDGISHTHAARFALVGTMNPEEGELRPQLLDRFGLMVELENCRDIAERQRIVKARLAFDLDPAGFRAGHAGALAALAERIGRAREALASVQVDDSVHEQVARLCIEAAVDGLRADLVMLRAARALAAFEGAAAVSAAQVERVAADVLRHRRTQAPAGAEPSSPTSSSTTSPSASRQTDQPARGANPPPRGGDASSIARDEAPAGDGDGGARDGDWGYLPPVPAGLTAVKGVIPLPSKKR
ncbi:ATP-binding protein [Burkholderia gladioli]|uniref:ATP-binding protein n=1 Tax=Burkholderia gladioli TaxID=28095 RepID=UPI0026536BAE|nr:ATP-binding protein [Burkholderia gladioli]MDN7812024.1 ATP-binding protein [Burkholderia gladioli]